MIDFMFMLHVIAEAMEIPLFMLNVATLEIKFIVFDPPNCKRDRRILGASFKKMSYSEPPEVGEIAAISFELFG